jgi:Flp pilus assembly protein TadD
MRNWAGRGAEVAAVFFAATLSPVLGWIMIATFRYSFVADHYQYLACLGPIALACAGLESGLGRMAVLKGSLRPVLGAGLLLALGALTWQQCRMYADEETLWRTTLARNPGSWMAENNLGLALARQGRRQEAMAQFHKALEIKPDDAKALNNLGNTLVLDGQVTAAEAQFRKALEVNPRDAEAHSNLAGALAMSGEPAEAIAQFRQALDLEPGNVAILNNFAWLLATVSEAALRNGAEAVALAQKANQLAGGGNPRVLHTLAAALAEAGRYGEACATARLAEGLASAKKNEALARMLRQEIPRYEAGLPLREK